MNSKDYWQERARRDKKHVLKQAETGILSIKRLLKLNLDDVEKKITAFYDKYGENPKEELSYNEFQKYKRDLAKNVKKYPKDKTLKKILKQDAPKYRIDRLRELQTQLQTELTYYTDLQEKATLKTLSSVATLSDTVNAKTISDMTGLKFTRVSKNTLNQIVNQTWVGRKNWSERIWADRELVGKKLTTVLQKGVIQGKPLKNMAFELQDVTHNSFNNCFRIIRTETSHIDGQIKLKNGLQAEKDLGERLKYQYDAFLDDRTSSICRELDGKKFWLDKAEVGVNYPPAHCNCRSTTFILVDEGVKKQDNEENSSTKKVAISKMEKTTEEKPLTKDQKEALEWYVSGEGQWVNQYLRDRGDFGTLSESEKEGIELIKQATDKPLPKDIKKLYRSVDVSSVFGDMDLYEYEEFKEFGVYGEKIHEAKYKNLIEKVKEKTFTEKGFMSTTKNKELALDWRDFTGSEKPMVLEITPSDKTKGIDLGFLDVEDDKQEEVLLHNGTQFKVKEVKFEAGQPYLRVDLI